jgi:hypothetical protein
MKGKAAEEGRLEAVQASLLLFLADGVHALLEVCAGDLCIAALLALFLDLHHAPTVLLLGAAALLSLDGGIEIVLQVRSAFTPRVAVGFELVALALQVSEGLLEGGGELLLGEEVLLDGADFGLLVFMDLGEREVFAAGSVAEGWRGRNGDGCSIVR